MTDLRGTSAVLALASDLAGRLYVRDAAGGLVAELRKLAGHPVDLGLEPGHYTVVMDAGGGTVFEARAVLADGQRTELGKLQFHPLPAAEAVVARGGAPAHEAPATDAAVAAAITAPPPQGAAPAGEEAAARYRLVPFSVGIFPVPGDGSGSEKVTKQVALGLIADRAARVDGLQIASVATITDEDARGVQAAAAVTFVGGSVQGIQTAGGVSVTLGSLRGAQAAGGVSYVQGNLSGLQLAGGAALALGSSRGAQGAGGLTYLQGSLVGFQAAGGANVLIGEGRGVQAAGGLNWAGRAFRGAQVAGGFNGAPRIEGAQIAVVNWGGDVNGTQVGVVNIAGRVRGAQVGVLNLANHSDGESVGVISLARNGRHHVEAFASDVSAANLALKLGTRYAYTTFVLGAHPGDRTRFSYGFGFGWHAPLSARLSMDVDLVGSYISYDIDPSENRGPEERSVLGSLRAVAAFKVLRRLAVMAGPTFNVMTSWDGQDLDISPIPALEHVERRGSVTVRLYPGIVLGVRI